MRIAKPQFDLSILIVNWNGKEMLRNLLISIEATRDGLAIQTIVIDNASADGSADMVAAEFPGVHLERKLENSGFARGNNQAARAARAPLLLLLNNDTLVRPGALRGLVQYLFDCPAVVAAGPKLIGADGKPQRSGRNLPTVASLLNSIQFLKWTGIFRGAYRRYRRDGFDPEKGGPVQQLAAAALMIRREEFQEAGSFDEGFGFGVEDVDLCKRLLDRGAIHYVTTCAIEHLGRVSSHANRAFVYRNYECGWARYIGKHFGRGKAIVYKLLVTLDMPVRVILFAIQSVFQTMFGRSEKAVKSRQRFKAAMGFTFTGLAAFWRS